MRKHLRRLERVWIDWPIYFITTCTFKRRPILASNEVAKILADEWRDAHDRHGWVIGPLRDHARSCSFLLPSRTGCEEIAGLYAGMEAVDKQADGARAQFLWNYLARTILRSRAALR